MTMATADIWQALRRCGEIFAGEESACIIDDVPVVFVHARAWVCVVCAYVCLAVCMSMCA